MREAFDPRSGRDHDRFLRLVLLFFALSLNRDGILADYFSGSLDPRDLVLLEQELDALGVLGADRAGALHRDAVIERDVANGDTELFGLGDLGRERCRFEQRFGGDAAPENAGAAQPLALDYCHGHSKLCSANGAHVSRRPTANEDHVVRGHFLS